MKTPGEGRGWNNLTGKIREAQFQRNNPCGKKPEGMVLRGKHPLVKIPRATFLVGKDREGGEVLGPSNGEQSKSNSPRATVRLL